MQLVECLPGKHEVLGLSLVLNKFVVVVYICNSITQEVEAGRSLTTL